MKNLFSLAAKMNTECLDYFPVSGLWDDASSDYLYATEEGIFLLPANAWMELDSTNDAEIVAQHGTRVADSWSMSVISECYAVYIQPL